MKLVINLDEAIRDEVDSEIRRFVKALVKESLKQQEAQVRKYVKQAAERDWKRVAKALEHLQQESGA